MSQKINEIISELECCAEFLYQEKLQAGYVMLTRILPKLENIVCEIKENEQLLLIEKLHKTIAIMESGDNTLLADVIQYEVIDQLDKYA